jgi:tRNA pseudouridine32 synthase/23S rRNA pseudouridine746 synthase/23S rRNA pseudouridine1911/1915/1917 synthase
MAKHSNPGSRHLPRGLSILYEDRDILVVDKPAGLLTIATDDEKERTAYHHLTEYVRKGQARSRNRIFIVHRLDRETSGVLVFAKTEDAKFTLQEHWEETEKTYLAVVPGHLTKHEGVIESYLTENTVHVVYSTNNPEKGKWSRTAYRVLRETKEHSLLEVDLLTGRKHQIRVHLANIGHPVVGDKKYGPTKEGHARLLLHAYRLSFPHPFTGRRLQFEAKVPSHFYKLVGNIEPSEKSSNPPGSANGETGWTETPPEPDQNWK